MSTSKSPERIGPYRVIERLGIGGMGEVFRAFDTRLERPVALKRLLASQSDARSQELRRESLRLEARAAASLNHPSLVRVHDLLESEEGDWLVLEMIEGEPLSALLKQGPLELETALSLAAELAEGLLALQDAGLVHNDIKAENVLVTDGGRVKMLDFGLAERIHDRREALSSEPVSVRGTPRTMAPERILGDPGQPESDLFSFGVLIYEMLAGRSPWRGNSGAQTLARVLVEDARQILELAPRTPPELAAWLHRMIDKQPSKRPSVREIVTALRAMASGNAFGSGSATTPEPGSKAVSRSSMADPSVSVQESTPLDESSTRWAGWRMTPPSLRRVVSVLCCRLTTDDGHGVLETEALFEVLPIFQRLATTIVDSQGGYLLHLGGHRLRICFGYPKAQEFAAERAVAAAFWLARELDASDRARSHRIRARVGVHCGFALELTGPRRRLVPGPTGDRARELEDLAKPGTVWVSPETHALMSSRFGGAELGGRLQIDGGSISAEFLGSAPADGFAKGPVGRDREVALLTEAFEGLSYGAGRSLLLAGESGMGKTNLLRFGRGLADRTACWLQASGVPFEFRGLVGKRGDDPSVGPMLLRQSLQQAGHDLSSKALRAEMSDHEDGETLARLLEPWLDPRESASVMPDPVKDAWLAWIVHRAEHRPLVIAIEDLQWVCESDLRWILELAESISEYPVVLVLTARPSFVWPGRRALTRLRLDRLDTEASQALLTQVTPGLEQEVCDRLIERGAGVPGDLEALASQPEVDAIPLAVRARLEARLEKLGEKRWLAQIAAAPGGVDRSLIESLLGDGPAGGDDPGRRLRLDQDGLDQDRLDQDGLDQEGLDQQIEELVTLGVLEAAGPGHWQFGLELLREVAWDCLLQADQERILQGRKISGGGLREGDDLLDL